ncbi:hypothetical protein JB92DRAFT_2773247, partial [Gautieria morchelliformis]
GTMVQVGYNSDPRHLSVWGFVQNLKKNKTWSTDEKFKKDRPTLGAIALSWNLFTSVAPKEVMDALQEQIRLAGMPETFVLSQLHQVLVPLYAGNGYGVEVDGFVLTFSLANRAPPEAYMVANYTAWVQP